MNSYKKLKTREVKFNFIIIAVFIGVIILALFKGRANIKAEDLVIFFKEYKSIDKSNNTIVLALRIPRIIAASLVGASLSVSGASYQGAFNNPLVAPDMLGVSAGACVGAALSIILNLDPMYMQIFAFLGGLLAVTISGLIPKVIGNNSLSTLVLAGIIVSGLFNSFLGLIKYLADPETQLASITYWQLGSLQRVSDRDLVLMVGPMLICLLTAYLLRWRLNIISLGEEEAKNLGLNIKTTRYLIIFLATMLTACSVCLTGTIAWIGLVVPHFARMLVGSDNRKVIPICIFLGASVLVLIDTLARTISAGELPISIFTGIIGAPSYFILLYRQLGRKNDG